MFGQTHPKAIEFAKWLVIALAMVVAALRLFAPEEEGGGSLEDPELPELFGDAVPLHD